MQWEGIKIFGEKITWSSSQRGGFLREEVLFMRRLTNFLVLMLDLGLVWEEIWLSFKLR
jgi:hypothetical protein